MKSIRQTTKTTRQAMRRWLAAPAWGKGIAYKAWQIAEADRRRAIEAHVPFSERYPAGPVAA